MKPPSGPKKQTQNKPNSNPIKPNPQKAKMNVNSFVTKDYRKNDYLAAQKTNPKQSQSQKVQNRLPENPATPAGRRWVQ